MFNNYLYKTNTSKKNYLHFKRYAAELDKNFKKKEGKILDIASNDGTFLDFFNRKKYFRLGIDPAKNLKKSLKKKELNNSMNSLQKKIVKKLKKDLGNLT